MVRALQTLSDEARCCLLLKVVQQLSYAEIAVLLQIPAGTAMSHVHRAKKALRECMTQSMAVQSGPADDQA